MSWLTAYYLTTALMFSAMAGLFVWLAWLRRQTPRRLSSNHDT